MKKLSFFLILFFAFMANVLIAQELPEIILPSPTVANLMRFEEVPVNHYTGIPDISIPIYNTKISNTLNLSIDLNYNPSGIRIDERSGWTGTGWSLGSESVISRTVMDVPDEIYSIPNGSISAPGDIGTFNNNFDEFGSINFQGGNVPAQWEEFVWKTSQGAQHYDYQPDLYQFSFFGFSGRFIIINENGNLVPKIVSSEQKVEININYNTYSGYNQNQFEITSFEVIDTSGNKFLFSAIETSTSTSAMQGANQLNELIVQGVNNPPKVMTYSSSWKLTSISSPNDNILATYTYNTITEEFDTPRSYESNSLTNFITLPASLIGSLKSYNAGLMPPKWMQTWSQLEIQSLKIKDITLHNQTKIEFARFLGHPEYAPLTGCQLNNIKVKNNNGSIVKNINLIYSTSSNNRLFLDQINDTTASETLPYIFHYEDKDSLPGFGSDYKDNWGYYNGNLPYYDIQLYENAVKKGLLTSIEYPTGGKKEFEYELHEIAYVGQELVNIYELPENRDSALKTISYEGFVETPQQQQSPLNGRLFFYIDVPQTININYNVSNSISNAIIYGNHRLELSSVNFSGYDPYATGVQPFPSSENDVTNITPIQSYVLNSNSQNVSITKSVTPGFYMLRVITSPFYFVDPSNGSTYLEVDASVNLSEFQYNSRNLKGGGLRIKHIRFTDNGIEKSKTSFNYDLDSNDSSLVNPHDPNIPLSSGVFDGSILMTRTFPKRMNLITPIECQQGNGFAPGNYPSTLYVFQSKKTLNSIIGGMTKGNYVGYKNVSVSQSNNGRTDYEFTTSLEYPNYPQFYYNWESPPYFEAPVPDTDYKRGLLTKQSIYNNGGDLLKEVANEYEFEEELATYQYYHTFYNGNCVFDVFYTNYYNFSNGIPDAEHPCSVDTTPVSGANCLPTDYIGIQPVYHKWGKSFLKETISKDYFYDALHTQFNTESRQTFVYNTGNFQIKEQNSYVFESGVEQHYKTKYYYPVGGVPASYNNAAAINKLNTINKINEVLVTENYKNGSLLTKIQNQYLEFNTDLIELSAVQVAKENNIPEDRIVYHKYDLYGHPLEVSKADGVHIVYIWGYNQSQPIAMIENLDYASIPTQTITNLQSLSDSDNDRTLGASGNEGALRIALNALRASYPEAMVSTYTYDPLVGVTSMTDAKGYTMYYEYDEFNRLKQVKDADGKILNETMYHYKQ